MEQKNNQVAAKTASNPAQQLAEFKTGVETRVMELISAGVKIPADYAIENQLKLAWLTIQDVKTKDGRSALEACTRKSIAESVMKMCVEGLSVAKKQCDFIVYGNELTYQREYHGTLALAKRLGGVQAVHGQIIYEGDVFKYTIDVATGRKTIQEHSQELENIDINKIRGAYAIVTEEDGSTNTEIMTMQQIRTAWNQGATKGNSPAHRNFTDQMALKTVISRACKLYISSSSDAGLIDNSRTEDGNDTSVQELKEEIKATSGAQKVAVDTIFETVDEKPTDAPKITQGAVEETASEPAPGTNTECPI